MAASGTPKTTASWLQQQNDEESFLLQKILEAFWDQKIKPNQANETRVSNPGPANGFKEFVKNARYGEDEKKQAEVEKLFRDALSNGITRETFCAKALEFGPNIINEMNNAEGLVFPSLKRITDELPRKLIRSELDAMQKYFQDTKLSGAVTLRTDETKLETPPFSENQSSLPYSIHSIGKLFTNMLALVMVKKGVLSDEELSKPLSKDFIASLKRLTPPFPAEIIEHLESKNINLHQLMNHEAGLGDYLEKYKEKIFRAETPGRTPEIKQIGDFAEFCETKTYPDKVGHFKYSNIGILLVGLAIEHAYKKANPGTPLDYDGILYEHILKDAGINRDEFTSHKPDNGKYNLEDKAAAYTVGSPAGGYWTTTENLAKFGDWIFRVSRDAEFFRLIEKHGKEFYLPEHQIITHMGEIKGKQGSSANLAVSLTTGSVVATLSDQPEVAIKLYSLIRDDILSGEHYKKAIKDSSPTIVKTPEPVPPIRDNESEIKHPRR